MDQSIGSKEQPRYIKLDERDNVAIVVNDFGLPAGSRFVSGLTLRAFVPQGHKTALDNIAGGAPIIRYGEVIGYALSPILAGEWVDEARIRMPDAPPLEGFTFKGYRNPDGSVGTKNILGISSSVQCVKGTMEFVGPGGKYAKAAANAAKPRGLAIESMARHGPSFEQLRHTPHPKCPLSASADFCLRQSAMI